MPELFVKRQPWGGFSPIGLQQPQQVSPRNWPSPNISSRFSGGGGIRIDFPSRGGGLPTNPLPVNPYLKSEAHAKALADKEKYGAITGMGTETDEMPLPIKMLLGGFNWLDKPRQVIYAAGDAFLNPNEHPDMGAEIRKQLERGDRGETTTDAFDVFNVLGYTDKPHQNDGMWWENGGKGIGEDLYSWVRGALGMGVNIATDPITWGSAGLGGLAKGAGASLGKSIIQEGAEQATKQTVALAAKNAAQQMAEEGLKKYVARAAKASFAKATKQNVAKGMAGDIAEQAARRTVPKTEAELLVKFAKTKAGKAAQAAIDAQDEILGGIAKKGGPVATWEASFKRAFGEEGFEEMKKRAPKAWAKVEAKMGQVATLANDDASKEIVRQMGYFAKAGQKDFSRLAIQLPFGLKRWELPGGRALASLAPNSLGENLAIAKALSKVNKFKANQVDTGSRLGAEMLKQSGIETEAARSTAAFLKEKTSAEIYQYLDSQIKNFNDDTGGLYKLLPGYSRRQQTKYAKIIGIAKEYAIVNDSELERASIEHFIAKDFVPGFIRKQDGSAVWFFKGTEYGTEAEAKAAAKIAQKQAASDIAAEAKAATVAAKKAAKESPEVAVRQAAKRGTETTPDIAPEGPVAPPKTRSARSGRVGAETAEVVSESTTDTAEKIAAGTTKETAAPSGRLAAALEQAKAKTKPAESAETIAKRLTVKKDVKKVVTVAGKKVERQTYAVYDGGKKVSDGYLTKKTARAKAAQKIVNKTKTNPVAAAVAETQPKSAVASVVEEARAKTGIPMETPASVAAQTPAIPTKVSAVSGPRQTGGTAGKEVFTYGDDTGKKVTLKSLAPETTTVNNRAGKLKSETITFTKKSPGTYTIRANKGSNTFTVREGNSKAVRGRVIVKDAPSYEAAKDALMQEHATKNSIQISFQPTGTQRVQLLEAGKQLEVGEVAKDMSGVVPPAQAYRVKAPEASPQLFNGPPENWRHGWIDAPGSANSDVVFLPAQKGEIPSLPERATLAGTGKMSEREAFSAGMSTIDDPAIRASEDSTALTEAWLSDDGTVVITRGQDGEFRARTANAKTAEQRASQRLASKESKEKIAEFSIDPQRQQLVDELHTTKDSKRAIELRRELFTREERARLRQLTKDLKVATDPDAKLKIEKKIYQLEYNQKPLGQDAREKLALNAAEERRALELLQMADEPGSLHLNLGSGEAHLSQQEWMELQTPLGDRRLKSRFSNNPEIATNMHPDDVTADFAKAHLEPIKGMKTALSPSRKQVGTQIFGDRKTGVLGLGATGISPMEAEEAALRTGTGRSPEMDRLLGSAKTPQFGGPSQPPSTLKEFMPSNAPRGDIADMNFENSPSPRSRGRGGAGTSLPQEQKPFTEGMASGAVKNAQGDELPFLVNNWEDADGNIWHPSYRLDGAVRVERTLKDGTVEHIGTFEDPEWMVEYINTVTGLKYIENPDLHSIDQQRVVEALQKFVDAGQMKKENMPAVLVMFGKALEMEQEFLDEIGGAENAAGITHKMVKEYTPGYIPRFSKSGMDDQTVKLMQAIGVDDPTKLAQNEVVTPGTRGAKFLHDFDATNPQAPVTAAQMKAPSFTKDKTYTQGLISRWRDSGVPFETDIAKRTGTRVGMGGEAIATDDVFTQLGAMFGKPLRMVGTDIKGEPRFEFENSTVGASDIRTAGNFSQYNDVVMNEAGTVAYKLNDPSSRAVIDAIAYDVGYQPNDFQKGMSKWIMPLMTIARPAHVLTNTIGNVDFMARNGYLHPESIMKATKIASYIAGRPIVPGVKETFEGVPLKIGQELTDSKQAAIRMMDLGVTVSETTDPMFAEMWNVLAAGEGRGLLDMPVIGPYLRNMRKINTYSENVARAGVFLRAKDMGLGDAAAAQEVRRVMLDYSQANLTHFEGTVRNVIPFYVFNRRNIPATLSYIAERPALFAKLYLDAPITFSESSTVDENGNTVMMSPNEYAEKLSAIPAMQRDTMGMPIFGKSSYINTRLPVNDIGGLAETVAEGLQYAQGGGGVHNPGNALPFLRQGADTLSQMVGPVWKMGAEGLTGADMETGAALDKSGNNNPLTNISQAFVQNFPLIGQFAKAAESEKKYYGTELQPEANEVGNPNAMEKAFASTLFAQSPRNYENVSWNRQNAMADQAEAKGVIDSLEQESGKMLPMSQEAQVAYIEDGVARMTASGDPADYQKALEIWDTYGKIKKFLADDRVDPLEKEGLKLQLPALYTSMIQELYKTGNTPLMNALPLMDRGDTRFGNSIPKAMDLFKAEMGGFDSGAAAMERDDFAKQYQQMVRAKSEALRSNRVLR